MAAAVVSLGQQERAMQLTAAELEAVYPNLREKLAEGLAAADAGKLSDGDAFFDELDSLPGAGAVRTFISMREPYDLPME